MIIKSETLRDCDGLNHVGSRDEVVGLRGANDSLTLMVRVEIERRIELKQCGFERSHSLAHVIHPTQKVSKRPVKKVYARNVNDEGRSCLLKMHAVLLYGSIPDVFTYR